MSDATDTLFWRRLDLPGLERLALTRTGGGLKAESTLLCLEGGGFRLDYQCRMDAEWRVLGFEIERLSQSGRQSLRLERAGTSWTVVVEEIDWIEASKDYLLIHFGDRTAILRGTIGGLEQELDPSVFARIHRSIIVQKARIADVNRKGERTTVTTTFGISLPVGPSFVALIDRL